MTPVIRSQGRPVRGVGEFGRIRLLERTRDAMKTKPKIDIQRREIAAFAGITPALVSYYFPDKWSLLEAAAKPIIDAYVDQIRVAITGSGVAQDKIRNLAYVLVEFNYEQGYLLDFYVDFSQREEQGRNLENLQKVSNEVGSFMEGLARCGLLRGNDAPFIQSALWSLCKTVGHALRANEIAIENRADVLWARVDLTCELLLNDDAAPSLSFEPDGLRSEPFDRRREARTSPICQTERSDAMVMRVG